jgi:hypothetical protein
MKKAIAYLLGTSIVLMITASAYAQGIFNAATATAT